MRISRRASLVVACTAVLGAFILATSTLSKGRPNKSIPDSPAPTPTPTPVSSSDSRFVLSEFHRSEVKDGKKLWEIFGTQGQLITDKNTVRVENPHLILYKAKGDTVDIKATSADVELNGSAIGKATLIGNVVVSYNSTSTLSTQSLIFDQAEGSVRSNSRVKVVGDIFEVEGDELRGNINDKSFTLLKNVQSTLKPKRKL